jgi:hypothetical protein
MKYAPVVSHDVATNFLRMGKIFVSTLDAPHTD